MRGGVRNPGRDRGGTSTMQVHNDVCEDWQYNYRNACSCEVQNTFMDDCTSPRALACARAVVS